MASNYSRLCWICVSILFFVRIEGISASGENNYFQYTLLKQDKSPSTLPTLRNFESLPNEGRTRRYVNGPISKLADAYNQGKSRFISNPQALTGGYVSPHVDSPAMQKETKSSYNSSQAQPAPDTSENRVHTTVSQSPLTTQINNNKPPVIPPAPNISSIVSADFVPTKSVELAKRGSALYSCYDTYVTAFTFIFS